MNKIEKQQRRKELIQELISLDAIDDVYIVKEPYGFYYKYLFKFRNRKFESFYVFYLDASHSVIKFKELTRGILNKSLVHPREVFIGAIKYNCYAILVAHNHPSGSLELSTEDKLTIRRLKEAGELLGIPLVDHILFSRNGFHSALEKGYLK